MKAITINGEIKTYSTTPKSWGNVIGGFNTLSDSDLEPYGFFNVEDIKTTHSDFDGRIHNIGALSFDDDNNVFKYAKTNKTFSKTLVQLKAQHISNLEHTYNREIGKTDWIVTKNLELGIDIPQATKDARALLRVECNNHEDSINALSSKSSVVVYDLPNLL